jgi:ATP-binding cassette subfamily B protein
MENIRYGCLTATDEEIIGAAKLVNAYDFIMRLEDGFDTDVGEGGDRLSSGEKQLISFARAIVGDPRLFVLDEATSSIDTETEQNIQAAVERILSGRTSFIVAHRLSTIRSCDRILLIDGGDVIESGNHKELMRKRGHYYGLYTNQFKQESANKLLGIENRE